MLVQRHLDAVGGDDIGGGLYDMPCFACT
jgi:hypothetical protein